MSGNLTTVGLEIHLRGGSVVKVDCSEFTTSRSRVDNRYTQLEWTTPPGATRRLHSIALDQIVAVVDILGDSSEESAR